MCLRNMFIGTIAHRVRARGPGREIRQKSMSGQLSVLLSLRMVEFTGTCHRSNLELSLSEDYLKFGGTGGTLETTKA